MMDHYAEPQMPSGLRCYCLCRPRARYAAIRRQQRSPGSPATQGLLCMAVRAPIFWQVRRALRSSTGKVRDQKRRSTG